MPSGRPWTAFCCKLRRALKKSAMEGLGRNPTDRVRSGSKIRLHVDGQGIPRWVTVRGANVHDSRLAGETLQSSHEMGRGFLTADIRSPCLDKGYAYPRVSEEIHVNGFEAQSVAGEKKSKNMEVSRSPPGSGTDICVAERFS